MTQEILTKSSDEFGTPDWLFNALNEEFHFTIDACASKKNTLLPEYWTKEDNSLTKSWKNHRVFCNPPYSRGNVEAFFTKALEETKVRECVLAVLLIPAYTERVWFHACRHMFECRFIQKRVKFIGGESSARGNHMILVFRNPKLAWWSP